MVTSDEVNAAWQKYDVIRKQLDQFIRILTLVNALLQHQVPIELFGPGAEGSAWIPNNQGDLWQGKSPLEPIHWMSGGPHQHQPQSVSGHAAIPVLRWQNAEHSPPIDVQIAYLNAWCSLIIPGFPPIDNTISREQQLKNLQGILMQVIEYATPIVHRAMVEWTEKITEYRLYTPGGKFGSYKKKHLLKRRHYR